MGVEKVLICTYHFVADLPPSLPPSLPPFPPPFPPSSFTGASLARTTFWTSLSLSLT